MGYFKPRELAIVIIVLAICAALVLWLRPALAGVPKIANPATQPAPFVQVTVGETLWRGETPIGDFEFVVPAYNFFKGFEAEFGAMVLDQARYNDKTTPANSILRAGVGDQIPGTGLVLGLGLAYVDNYLPYNGQHENFALTAGYRFKRLPVVVQYLHFSDASERLPNIGRDLIEIGWRW